VFVVLAINVLDNYLKLEKEAILKVSRSKLFLSLTKKSKTTLKDYIFTCSYMYITSMGQ